MNTKKNDIDIEDAEIITEKATSQGGVEPNLNYSPFDEPVKQRDYTKPNIDTSNLESELKEPTFEAPQFIDEEEIEQQERASEPFNPAFNELGNKEKELGAEMVSEIILDGWSKIKELGGSLATINEDKLEKEFAEGTINPQLPVPIDAQGNTATVREYVQEFNETTREACKTSEEFKDSVRPALIRVLKKKGIGMTDEQFLAYKFGADGITFGMQIYGLKKSANNVVNAFREQSTMYDTPPPPPPPSRQAEAKAETPPPSSRPAYSEPEEVREVQPNTIAVKPKAPSSNFSSESKVPDNMPEFGDPSILNEIDKIAKRESRTKTPAKKKGQRGRPRKS